VYSKAHSESALRKPHGKEKGGSLLTVVQVQEERDFKKIGVKEPDLETNYLKYFWGQYGTEGKSSERGEEVSYNFLCLNAKGGNGAGE